jgi:hypothetical protein
MCFNKTKESKLLVAKRDITVYKVGCFADEVDADDWKQTVKELGITRWLYIDDLLPKEGGK